ncbi:MAG: hypothetical protein KDB88_06950, partial [Flavobacteriales bacterium]|nr:hypothetical protein [Flavobacteriales bacterium]
RYPLYIFPGRYVSLLGQQAPIFLLASDPVAVGQFAFATALLLMPLRLIGYSLSSVFQQKAVETYRTDPNALGPLTRRFQERLFFIGLLPFAVIAFFGDLGFGLVLGEGWRISGIYAAWMSLYFMLRLLSEPIISLLNVLGREQDMLSIHGALLVLRVLGLLVGLHFIGSVHVAVMLYVAISTIGYVGLLAHLYKLVSIARWRTLGRMLLVFCIVSLACCAVRYLIIGDVFPLV